MCLKIKGLFQQGFRKGGRIFGEWIIEWERVKELTLKGIFQGVQALESFAVLDVLEEVISLMAHIVAIVEKLGVKSVAR